jgi:hypothetical protein
MGLRLASAVVDLEHLRKRWYAEWACPPIGHLVRHEDDDRWVRFHSLPHSKRYPDTELEYSILLGRHNTVLDEIFAGQLVHVSTVRWATDVSPGPAWRSLQPGARLWTTVPPDSADGDLMPSGIWLSSLTWRAGRLDPLLRAVADDEVSGVLIADADFSRVYHPYDGGADVIMADQVERDALRDRHPDWLSSHPLGL